MNSRRIALKDRLVEQIRLATNQDSVTRIVFDLHSAACFRISRLSNPTRIFVELSRNPIGALDSQDPSSPSLSHQTPPATNASAPPTYAGRVPMLAALDASGEVEMEYAGTPPVRNVLMLGLTMGSSYDDNVFGNNQRRIGDVSYLLGPTLSLRSEGSRLSLVLDYRPQFRIYRNASNLNSIDQGFIFGANYKVDSRLAFRASTLASYTSGLYQSNQNGESPFGIGSPSNLNTTVFAPTVRQLIVSSRIDVNYLTSIHDSVDLYIGQSTLNFEHDLSNNKSLENSLQRDTGLLYRHRLTPHTTVGIDYLFQNIRFGSEAKAVVQSVFLSYAQQLSPSLSLSVFGGPQYSSGYDLVALLQGPTTLRSSVSITQWSWATGGILTKRLDKTVFQLAAQHQVSDGGGLLGAVVNSAVETNLRRQLGQRWETIWSARYAHNSSLALPLSQGGYESLTVGVGLQRSLTERLSLGVRYDLVRQNGTGQSALFGNFDRDLWSVQLSYRFHRISLGQ